MDPRKQKRLGPAPIASFEKSFEDTPSTPHIGNNAAVHNVIHETETQDINRNSDEMEPHGNITRTVTTNTKTITTTTATATATSTTMTIGREVIQQLQQQQLQKQLRQQQQQQQQPSISVSQTATAGSTKAKVIDGNPVTATATYATITKPRPPPLKATTASGATTTLVSSGEQQVTFRGATTLTAPSTPRIELSRASSSSHHEEDSRDSSPENVFEQVGTGTLQEAIGLGFREEGTLELRSSTEELYFMDPEHKKEEQEKLMQQQQQLQQQNHQQLQQQLQQRHQQQQQQHQMQPKRSSPLMFKNEDHQSYLQQHQRKDSASSEVAALLCISGRTSRISSVGSQGSAVSRLSAVSGVSRSPSPHRMLLETSFCGPKPLENLVDGRVNTVIEPATAEILEQVLLARKHDPTQAVLAEGIHVESSPKRTKPTTLSNGDPKINAKIALQNRPAVAAAASATGTTAKSMMGHQRQSTKSPGQMIIGKTPSGTEYIRINLKPDHMYDDKGIAPNELVVEAPNSFAPVTSKKPISLSLGRSAMDETRLTPNASPKPTRHVLGRDAHGSRSPSPATANVSRKSSFSSLFRVGGKDSPDSPRDRGRSRSKSKERQTPQSLNATPSKQKSVLAIFKPNKRGSNAGADAKSSKSSSPIEGHDPHLQQRSKSNTPLETATGSRPASRLRYYDEAADGIIHIPLHTPPEEKETRKILQGIAQLTVEPMRPVPAPVTASQLMAAAAALKPVGTRKGSGTGVTAPRPPQIEKLQRIENLDAIHPLPQDDENKDRTWSLEVQRHSSQDSQETVGSEGSYASAIRMSARSNLTHLHEHPPQETGVAAAAEIHRLPSEESTVGVAEIRTVETIAMVNVSAEQCMTDDAVAKERRRLLFATRIGSGSQEQIFSTQFSISKTESQSSQLSEQVPETIPENAVGEYLQRKDTVIRRTEDAAEKSDFVVVAGAKGPLKRLTSKEAVGQRQKSISTSEDEKTPQQTTVAAIVLRRKESSEELRRKSRSTSEEDAEGAAKNNQRHSRYLENFDVRRKNNENVPRKPKRQSISTESSKGEAIQLEELPAVESTTKNEQRQPVLPQPPPPSTAPTPSPPPPSPQAAATVSRSPTPPTKSAAAAAHRSQSQSPIEKTKPTPSKPPRTSTPTRRSSQTASPPSPSSTASPQMALKVVQPTDRQSVNSTDEPNESSESERDSELVANSAAADPKRHHLPRHVGTIEDHESTGLVSQESFDDELPYIPTTLPEERAQGVSLIPMKERANMELKTCPVDRPRSTTPLNPSHLEEYCGIIAATPPEPTFIASGSTLVRGEKLRISLPRKESIKEKAPQNTKSPRRPSNAGGKTWFEFAEEGLRATTKDGKDLERKDSNKQLLPKKPTPEVAIKSAEKKKAAEKSTPVAAKPGSTRKLSGHWIDFENIPEKRKPAKRITALPKDTGVVAANNVAQRNHHHAGSHHHSHHSHGHGPPDVAASAVNSDGKTHYNYVKPEDCQCECHEVERESSGPTAGGSSAGGPSTTGTTDTASKPALANVDLLQQGEDMLPLLDPDIQDGIEPSDSSRDYNCYTDDEADVPMRQSAVGRHRAPAPRPDEFPRRDGSRSPRSKKFPDHRYS